MIVVYIALAIVVLLFMVLIHELGHYVVGRWLGFKITEFSIGFGKVLWQKTNKRGEKISLRLFPLGGFCAFYGEAGEDEDENGKVINEKDDPEIFTNKPPWKRILVFIAGATFNLLSAFIFSFILLWSFGYGNVYNVQGVNQYFADNYVQGEGLRLIEKNDKILEIRDVNEKNSVRVDYVWEHTLENLIELTDGNKYELTIQKNETNEIIKATITVFTDKQVTFDKETGAQTVDKDAEGNDIVYTGIGMSVALTSQALSFVDALSQCFMFTIGLIWMVLKALFLLLTFQLPLSELGGTATVISVIANNIGENFAAIFIYLPLLAANLGAFNLVPFPALDGSHTLFTLIEWIRGKPINRDVEAWIHFIGLIILFAFVILVDFIHFFC